MTESGPHQAVLPYPMGVYFFWILSKRVVEILRVQGVKACLPQAGIQGFK